MVRFFVIYAYSKNLKHWCYLTQFKTKKEATQYKKDLEYIEPTYKLKIKEENI